MTLIASIGFLSMGNQSCQKDPTAARQLKMDVEISRLAARQVTMPTGEVVDFPYIANALFYQQVINHDYFVLINPIPSPVTGYGAPASKTSSALIKKSFTATADEDVLSQYGFFGNQSSAVQKADLQSFKLGDASEPLPTCLYDLPQAMLSGEVISFEANWGVGLGLGYNTNGSLAGNAGGSVQFQQAKLELGLRTDNPLSQQVIAIGDGVSHQSKVNFGLNFLAGLPIGLNFFYNTPITDVIRSAMNEALDKLVAKYESMFSTTNSWSDVWESRVIDDPVLVNGDTHIAIRSGYRAGVKVGDTFEIRNMYTKWEGAACYTRLKYQIPLTQQAIAEATVVAVGDNVSVALVKNLADDRVLPGAQVKIKSLWQPPATTQN